MQNCIDLLNSLYSAIADKSKDPKFQAQLKATLSEYELDVAREAVHFMKKHLKTINRTDNPVMIVESYLQNVAFRRLQLEKGTSIAKNSPARRGESVTERGLKIIRRMKAGPWKSKKYIPLNFAEAPDLLAFRQALPKQCKFNERKRQWYYRRETAQERVMYWIENGNAARGLQKQASRIPRDSWPEIVDAWLDAYTGPLPLPPRILVDNWNEIA